MPTDSSDSAKPATKPARPRCAEDASARTEVKSVQSIPAGKVAVVTLRDWLPRSSMQALREELKAATGHEPVILPPGAELRTMAAKDADGSGNG